MSDTLQVISRASSQQWTVLSRASSLGEFEIVDAEPTPEVESAAEDAQSNAELPAQASGPTVDIEEYSIGSDEEFGFEEIVPQAEIAEETPPADAEHQHDLPAPQFEDEDESLHSEHAFQFNDIESVASAEIPWANTTSEAEVADESFHSEADVQVDESDYMATSDSVAAAWIPKANLTSEAEFPFEESATPAEIQDANAASEVEMLLQNPAVPSLCQYFALAELQLEVDLDSCDGASVQLEEPEASLVVVAKVGSSARARRRQSLAPAEVTYFADAMRQNASEGLSEAVRLIHCFDDRLNAASPHVVDGVAYLKRQVHDDFQSTVKDMSDSFGEGQESEPTVAATFSHFKDQLKNDFKNIRKDVDSAFGCILGSTELERHSEQVRRQKTLKKAIPAATCSIVSMAVASWLVPVRLARLAAANIAM